MEKTQKRNNGITLVALVVTIIILLILAGITISQLTESGLFENAKLAEQESKEAEEKEEGILSDYENKIGEYVDGSRDTIIIDKEEYEKMKNRMITELQAHTTDNYGTWRADEKEGYIAFSIKPIGTYYAVTCGELAFRIFGGNGLFTQADEIKNTSISAYVLYLKVD